MSDDIDFILKRKALELAARQLSSSTKREERPMTKEEIIAAVRGLLRGDRADEIFNTALELYGDSLTPLLKKIVELNKQGVIKELWDYELYKILTNAGYIVPLKSRVRIVRHGREYKFGETD